MQKSQFSPMAENILVSLKANEGSMWEYRLIDAIFPAPAYSEGLRAVAQHDTNKRFTDKSKAARHWVGGQIFEDFYPTVDASYQKQVFEGLKELKAAGIVVEHNNGFNEYSFELV